MKVTAIRTGYIELRRYKEGAEFELANPALFSAAWMKPSGEIPKEFKEQVESKIDAYKKRKTPDQLRREATDARDRANAVAQARVIAEAVAGAVGPAVSQALAIQREEHTRLMAAASKPTGK